MGRTYAWGIGGPGLGSCTQASPARAALGLCLPAAALTLVESRGGDCQGLRPFGEGGAWWRRPPGRKEVLTEHTGFLGAFCMPAEAGTGTELAIGLVWMEPAGDLTPNLFTCAS